MRLLRKRAAGSATAPERVVRRFLRDRPGRDLALLVAHRRVALAAVTVMLAAQGAPAVPPIELADVVAGQGGFSIDGVAPQSASGRRVSGAGDVNGDGLSDVIVSANNHVGAQVYVVFGKASGTPVDLADVIDGQGGFVINEESAGDLNNNSVSGAGDVNGDGLDDVMADGASVDLNEVLAGHHGFAILGAGVCNYSGEAVSGGGDLNGDGLDDVLVSTGFADDTYVVFGKADGTAVDLGDVAGGDGGFVIRGLDVFNRSVSGARDVDGDGFSDVVVGAPFADGGLGQSYVVFSPFITGDLDEDGLVGTTDLLILLSAWGACPRPCVPFCPGDLDRDCAVGTSDLLLLIAGWG